MKTIIKVAILAAFIFGPAAAIINTEAYGGPLFVTPSSRDQDRGRGRGRGRGRDDGNSSYSNSRSNSNSRANSNSSSRSGSARISFAQARRTALRSVSGSVVKSEFENRRGRPVYEFYIRKSSGQVFEVYVDAVNGRVIKTERRSR